MRVQQGVQRHIVADKSGVDVTFGQRHDQLRSTQTVPASVAQLAETQCAPTETVCRRNRGSISGWAGRFHVRISGAHALRLISQQAKRVRRCPL